ncbi:hypothetical protein [Lysinibacillus capsici]|uniref:hypothetical protein n=1 Tax=Lysinibacillus capsici TaxID=2115968 RepID=UPI000E1FC6AB|nr:hypothetical protein [Lysinibacillus capsici]RDV25318.1 hypothetical protein C7B89_22805 [Lysinibacillus capsici]
MSEETLAICLSLFKLDLGITHDLRDEIFINRLKSTETELVSKPIDLSKETAEDIQLIVDYALWQYRKRQEDVGLSRNLQFRIHNRVIQKVGANDAQS